MSDNKEHLFNVIDRSKNPEPPSKIRKSLEYHNIPKRALDSKITYDREIDISAVLISEENKTANYCMGEFYDSEFREDERKKMKEEISKEQKIQEFLLQKHAKEEEEINNIFTEYNPPKILDDKSSDHGWIQTYNGHKFFPLNPREEDIYIEDA